MSNYKEFQGKSLDEAIQEACDHFGLKRDKLEVEIVSGGSTGIFGLVGAKKATVKARPRNANSLMEGGEKPARDRGPKREAPAQRQDAQAPARRDEAQPPVPRDEAQPPVTRDEAQPPVPRDEAQPPASRDEAQPPVTREEAQPPVTRDEAQPPAEHHEAQPPARRQENKPAPKKRERKPRQPREQREPRQQRAPRPRQDNKVDEQPQIDPFADINKEELEQTVREVTVTLIEQLVMAPKLEVKVGKDRVNVLIDEPEHSGLIIGREGQTLSSLQYLVNRIVSRRMETSVRVQIDTGDYRERQDDKLRQTADHLAEKARKSGRTQSTKPLSSYHRRIVHLALQDDERVFTRSKGEGPMKRVLIVPKKRRGGGRGTGRDEHGDVNGNR